MRPTTSLILATVISIFCFSADALNTIYDGTESWFWASHAVVLAKTNTHRLDDGRKIVNIKVLAVAVTDFRVPTEIEAEYTSGGDSNLSDDMFGLEQPVLVCIEKTETGWLIPSFGFKLFPSASAVVKMKSADDLAVDDICNNLAKARATARSKAPKDDATATGDKMRKFLSREKASHDVSPAQK